MIRRQQFIQHRTVNFLFGASEREVRYACRTDDNFMIVPEIIDYRLRRPHHIHTQRTEPVRHRGSTAAGSGHDGYAVTLAGLRARDHRAQFKQRLKHVDAQNAVRLEKSIRQFVGTRHGSRMRRGAILPDFRAAQLEHDNRLAPLIGTLARARKVMGVTDRFHEQQYLAGIRIVHQHIGEFADADIGLVAH